MHGPLNVNMSWVIVAQEQVAGCCERANEHSGSIK